MSNISILMKVLEEKEHCENFRKGNLLFRSPQVFNKTKDSNVRGDRFDGYDIIYQPNTTTIEINGIKIEGVKGCCGITYDKSIINTKICSLYVFNTTENFYSTYDERIKVFGKHCVVITQPKEFFIRLQKKISNKSFECKKVEYVDFNVYDGKLSIFKKDMKYNWQNEYRLKFYDDNPNPNIYIDIGDIKDITEYFLLEDFLAHFKKNNCE